MEKIAALFAKKHYFNMCTVEEIIGHDGTRFDNFKKSVVITQSLMQRIRVRAEGTPIVVFTVDGSQPYLSQFKNIFKKINIIFVYDISDKIRQKEKEGIQMRLKDGAHWNGTGQQMCGELLVKKLYQLGYGPKNIH